MKRTGRNYCSEGLSLAAQRAKPGVCALALATWGGIVVIRNGQNKKREMARHEVSNRD
jgi:hypothetical protein